MVAGFTVRDSGSLDAASRRTSSLDAASRRRAELRQAVHALADAVEAPASPAWRTQVAASLAALRQRLAEHVAVTEGAGGLYAEVLEHAPRLSRQVETLTAEHRSLEEAVDALARRLHQAHHPVTRLRAAAEDLLADLAGHRQRGADLVYEAYATDIGGET